MQEVAGHSHQGFFSLSPRSAHPWPKPSLFLVLHVPRVLRGDSELPRVRLGEVGLGRRKIFWSSWCGDEAAGSDSRGAQPVVTKGSQSP